MDDLTKLKRHEIRQNIVDCINTLAVYPYNDTVTENAAVMAAYKFIAFRAQFDCVCINAESVMRSCCKQIKCSMEVLVSVIDEYIRDREAFLRQRMNCDRIPSAEELMEYVLEKHFEGIYAEAVKNKNTMPESFSAMLFNPVIRQWQNKWESMCTFRARLYDIHNKLSEESGFGTMVDAVAFVNRRKAKRPDAFSRYVILIKTPFNRKDYVVYTVKGVLSTKNVCRKRDGACEWRAHFYDYRDRRFSSVASPDYLTPKELMKHCLDKGALYYVLTYCKTPGQSFTVQYFRTVRSYNNPDAVSAIDKMFFNYEKN